MSHVIDCLSISGTLIIDDFNVPFTFDQHVGDVTLHVNPENWFKVSTWTAGLVARNIVSDVSISYTDYTIKASLSDAYQILYHSMVDYNLLYDECNKLYPSKWLIDSTVAAADFDDKLMFVKCDDVSDDFYLEEMKKYVSLDNLTFPVKNVIFYQNRY